MEPTIQVIIADDGAFLDTCSHYFDGTSIHVLDTARTVEEAIEKVIYHQKNAQVLILDVDLGNGRYGTEVVKAIRQKRIPIKILIVSGLVHEIAFVLPFKGLVEGILHKNEDKSLIKKAVRGIALGKTGFYSPECADILLNRDFRNFYNLKEDEIKALYLLTQGYTNTNRIAGYFVAEKLDIPHDKMPFQLKQTKYLLQEDIPHTKNGEKSVFDILFYEIQKNALQLQKFNPILNTVRKQIKQPDGTILYEVLNACELPLEEQLVLILKREEGRIRRDILPNIFTELDVESTIESLLWAQKWDLAKLYQLSN